jgi:hypothetical protein
VRFAWTGNGPRLLPAAPPGLDLLDRWVADAVGECHHLLIRYGERVSRARLIAQIARRHPDARIAVVAARDSVVYQTRKDLRRCRIEAEPITRRYCPQVIPRVIVSTFGRLAQEKVKYCEVDIVIVLDAVEAVGEDAQLALEWGERARLIGLLDVHSAPSPRERAWVFAIFGRTVLVVPRHGRRQMPVDVATVGITGGPMLPNGLGDLEVLRQGVWRSPVHNRRLARLAQAFACNDVAAVRRDCPAAVEHVAGGAALRVVMLVAGVEQAIAVARLLPAWPIVTGASVHTIGLGTGDEELLWQRRVAPWPLERAIVTTAGLNLWQVEYADVLIRADGGVDIPTALVAATRSHSQAERRLLLVDCDDRHHRLLRVRSRQRQAAYSRQWGNQMTAAIAAWPPADASAIIWEEDCL